MSYTIEVFDVKQVKPMTVKQVASVTKEGLTCIGGVKGLYLMIKGGGRYYLFRYLSPATGKRSFVSLGSTSDITLAQAREMAAKYAAEVRDGIDIAQKRREQREQRKLVVRMQPQAKIGTFESVARQWLDARVKTGYYDKNVRGVSVVEAYLSRNIYPVLGKMPISAIRAQDVFRCLKPIWTTTTEAKNKCLTIINGVFRWAQAMGMTDGNPADKRGALGVLLENLSPHVKRPMNHGALDPEEMPEFFCELMNWGTIASKAFAFAILTASRSKAVRTAKWADIDLDAGTWACPESAMKVKGRGIFVVLLSPAAIRLLKSLPRFAGTDLVFPSPYKHVVMSDTGLGQIVGDMNAQAKKQGLHAWIDKAQSETTGREVRITVHGTSRATFKTWTKLDANLKRFDRDAVELCLAHKLDDGYGGAYDRAAMIEERRRIMDAWGEYCCSKLNQPAKLRRKE